MCTVSIQLRFINFQLSKVETVRVLEEWLLCKFCTADDTERMIDWLIPGVRQLVPTSLPEFVPTIL